MPPLQSWEVLPKQSVLPRADFHTPKPPPRIRKPRARKNSYRNKNAIKVSVKRGTEELSGRERRIRINELLWFIPSQRLNLLTPKELETVFQAHQCSICEKVFRLVSGVKIHMQNEHEKRTLFHYFKKDSNNNGKAAVKSPANVKISPQNPDVSFKKSSSVKMPTYQTNLVPKSPKIFRNKLNNNDNKASSVPNNISQTPTKRDEASGAKSPKSPYMSSGKKSSVGDFFKCKKRPKYLTKPKLMSPKTYRKISSTPDIRDRFKTQEDGKHLDSYRPAVKDNLSTQVILQPKCKPKLMTQKKWKKKLALTQQKNNEDELSAKSVEEYRKEDLDDNVENDPDVKEFFDYVKSQPVLLD